MKVDHLGGETFRQEAPLGHPASASLGSVVGNHRVSSQIGEGAESAIADSAELRDGTAEGGQVPLPLNLSQLHQAVQVRQQ